MKKILIICFATIILNSCSIYTKYSRPEDISAEKLFGETVQENTDSVTIATLLWKELFTDTQLQALIETGLTQNTNLASAEQTIKQAQAAYKASKLAFVPGFTFVPQGGYDYNLSASSGVLNYSVPIVMDWELDIFGKMYNTKRKCAANLAMAYDYRQAVQTQVVANIANFYYQLLMLDEQLVVMEKTAIKWKETLRIMKAMKEAGMQNEASVSQTAATCYAIDVSVLEVKKAILNVENALCVLLRQTPHTIARGKLSIQTFPEELKVGVSAQLLANRPDVRQAEHNLEQTFYGVNYARASFYPSVKISASALWNGNFLLSALASLTQPIFAHGGLKAQLEAAKGEFEKAKLAFSQQLIQAGSEVNDALLQCQTARDKHILRQQQIEFLQTAVNSTQSLMTYGSTTYLDVIYAQQALLEAEISVLSDWLEEATGIVALYQALGGGE